VEEDFSEAILKCPICKQLDKAKNMVRAFKSGDKSSWMGSAHLRCIQAYNKHHASKYRLREYDEKGKHLGESTLI
jgi:hypothetical protein